KKIQKARLPPPSMAGRAQSDALDAIVMHALEKDCNKRFQSASEAQLALEKASARDGKPFGTPNLARWMRHAFAEEILQEKARLTQYARVRSDGSSGPTDAEATEVDVHGGAAPASAHANLGSGLGHEDWSDEPTQIFFSSADVF